jgi:hypothetical protein
MIRTVALLAILFSLFDSAVAAQTNSAESASSVWSTLSAPAMDPAKFAHTENVSIVRDHVHITLTDGTIQFARPVNGVIFGAVFHGTGRVQADPPNATEAQQLRLFTKQDKLAMTFSEATFSFTDGLVEEVAKQAKWKDGAPPSDDLYTKRQKEREDLGESVLPRLLQSITSTDRVRTAFFLADLKTNEKGWVEIHDDALEPEEIGVGRWVNIGPVKTYDTWMSFPAGGRTTADAWKNPEAKQDFSIRSYNLDVSVTSGAEMQATAKVEIAPRFSGENTLVFGLDSNLRVEYVKDSKGNALTLFQARENKDRFQSYGNYVAVALPGALEAGTTSVLEFRYGGKRAIRKAGTGNYFCESSGWYPELPNSFAARANFEVTFRSPKNLALLLDHNPDQFSPVVIARAASLTQPQSLQRYLDEAHLVRHETENVCKLGMASR